MGVEPAEPSLWGPQLQMPEGLAIPVLMPPPLVHWKPPEWATVPNAQPLSHVHNMPTLNGGHSSFVDGLTPINLNWEHNTIANGVNPLPVVSNECAMPISAMQTVSSLTFPPAHTDIPVPSGSVGSVNLIPTVENFFYGPAGHTTTGQVLANAGQPSLLQTTAPPFAFYPTIQSMPPLHESTSPRLASVVASPQQSSPPLASVHSYQLHPSCVNEQPLMTSGTHAEWPQPSQQRRTTPKAPRGVSEEGCKKLGQDRGVHPTLSEMELLSHRFSNVLQKCKSRTTDERPQRHHSAKSSARSSVRTRSADNLYRERLMQSLQEAEDVLGRMAVDWKTFQNELEIAREAFVGQEDEHHNRARQLQPEPHFMLMPLVETEQKSRNRPTVEKQSLNKAGNRPTTYPRRTRRRSHHPGRRQTSDVSYDPVYPLSRTGTAFEASLHQC